MSSLKAKVGKQLQLYSMFLGSSDVMLKTIDLPMIVEEDRSNLKLFVQKISLKESPVETKVEN
jgi:PP-loop superfamily ATP-utilizing enzyme